MLISKVFMAVVAIALGAAVLLALPGFSPQVEARTPPPAVKGDRLDARPIGQECTQQAWPYYEANCLRNTNRRDGQARTVRFVSTDRVAH